MRLVILCVSGLILVTSSFATIIHVPADQPNIQAGVVAALSGDTVLVAPGVYTGNGNRDIDFLGKNVVLLSQSGALATTIDCHGTEAEYHRAVYLHSNEGTASTIEGFTITGAFDSLGAISCVGTGLTIKRCIISGNSCDGVRRIRNGGVGGQRLVIDSCVINNNLRNGIYTIGNFSVCNSVVTLNDSNGLWSEDPTGTDSVEFMLFVGNGLAGMGGRSFAGHMAVVRNCTFVANHDGLACVLDMPFAGAANADWPSVENSIMAYNLNYGYNCGGYVSPTVTCCNSFGNGFKNWNTFNDTPPGADTLGNFSRNPLFCDTTAADFRLMDVSPNAPSGNSCNSLIGAFPIGCLCCTGTTGNIDLAGIVDLTDLSALVSYLTGGNYVPLCPTEANVNTIGIIDLSDLSALVAYLTGGGYILPNCQ